MPNKQYYSADDILGKALGTDAYFRVKGILQDLTPADVAPVVHGRWIEHRGEYENWCECSVCRETPDSPLDETPFCPHCGAKMDLDVHPLK